MCTCPASCIIIGWGYRLSPDGLTAYSISAYVAYQFLFSISGYSEDQKFKDFIYCCYKTAGYLKPDGRMNTEKSVKLFKNEPEVVNGLMRCGEENGRDAKEAVFNFFKCFQDTVPVRFTLG